MENALYVGGFEMEQKTAMKISMVSIVGNILLSLFKALAGIVANSGAMISDAIHSASDVFSTIVVIIGIRLSGKESDKEHPYGHERMECVAAILLATILAATGLFIGWSAVEKITVQDDSALAVPGILALVAAVVSIAVKDEGIGISKDKVSSIFERFTTVSKENDMQPSSGIGLSLVNELVKMLHGEIQVESEVKKGSVFKLVLHKGKEIYAQDKNVEYILNDTSEEQETVLAEPEQNDKTFLPDMPPATKETLVKVMVVEDNAELRQFICEILSGTYRVVGVADGVMALEKIEEEIPDFIITDIMMPRMDGIELIRHIKENVNTCDIPLIILSAKSSVEDRIQCLQLGIDDYIPKPFSSDYLKSRIESLIRQRKVLQSAFLSKYGAQPKKEPLEAVAYPVSQIVPLDELFMQKLVGFMEENYSNPGLRVNDLAEFMNMSRSVFNRKVNGIMGISPIEYIKNYRLNKAKSFIQSGMSFSEVAFAVGFSDPGYFGKAFKKAFNQTLTEYKNNN